MTYSVGDPGHVKAHGDLVSSINVELARFGLTGALPIKEEGAEGHLDDHNAIRAKLDELATTAGQSFSTPLPPVRQLGDGSHTDDHNILAECASEAATWPAWNAASGGLEQSIANYNGTGQRWMVHTFTGNGTFTVTRATQPFRVLVAGGGGGGGGGNGGMQGEKGGGGGGGAEVLWNDALALATGAHSVTIGNGGNAGAGNPNGNGSNGGDGGITVFAPIGTARAGLRGGGAPHGSSGWAGASGNGNAGAPNNSNGRGGGTAGNYNAWPNGHSSTITGSTVEYGRGGAGAPPAHTGQGGGGGGSYSTGHTGASGVVIVAYRIS